jgi:LysR family transcriptional regulator, low CO2-responsive transcriptional regulator
LVCVTGGTQRRRSLPFPERRAAEASFVTPPAVSLQLRQLEELVGIPLLERLPTGYQPTDAGGEVLAASERIERALAECAEALDMLRGGEAGRIALGVISTAKYFVPAAVAGFRRDHPRIEIRLIVANREGMLAALENYELDLAITGRPPEPFEVKGGDRRSSARDHRERPATTATPQDREA